MKIFAGNNRRSEGGNEAVEPPRSAREEHTADPLDGSSRWLGHLHEETRFRRALRQAVFLSSLSLLQLMSGLHDINPTPTAN